MRKARTLLDVVPSEFEECKAFYQWAMTYPKIGNNLIKICNEGKRTYYAAKSLQSIGLRKGVPDYILTLPNKKYGALWLEMKRRYRYSSTPDQSEWINRLLVNGHYACFCYGWEHAKETVMRYLNNAL